MRKNVLFTVILSFSILLKVSAIWIEKKTFDRFNVLSSRYLLQTYCNESVSVFNLQTHSFPLVEMNNGYKGFCNIIF